MPSKDYSDLDTPTFSSPASSSSPLNRTKPNVSDSHDGRPRTAPVHQIADAASPLSSPRTPSTLNMRLYSLGMGHSPLSPLRRQFTASRASALQTANADADDELSDVARPGEEAHDQQDSSSEEADFADDSKEVLMDRLNDLLHRLAISGSLKGDDVSSLHAKVDEMEKVLASGHSKPARSWNVQQQPSLMQLASPLPVFRRDGFTYGTDNGSNHWSLPTTPTRPPSLSSAELSGPISAQKEAADEASLEDEVLDSATDVGNRDFGDPQETDRLEEGNDSNLDQQLLRQPQSDSAEVETSSSVAEEVLFAAQKLCDELNRVLQDLQDRKEESDHLHAMLIDRAEGAARRIMELDDLVLSLEEELAANKSDLEHLRLQLRAVEVLVPADADRDLLQSIENWKADYSRLKLKMAAKRRERRGDGEASSVGLGSPSTSMLIERAGLLR